MTHEERVANNLKREKELEAEVFGSEEQGIDEPVEESSEVNDETTVSDETTETVPGLGEKLPPDDGAIRKELAELQHRFNRMKGSNDLTIHNLRKQVALLNQKQADHLAEIANLKAATSIDPVENFDAVFSKDVIDVLGEEQVNAIKTVVTRAEKNAMDVRRELEASKIEQHEVRARDAHRASEQKFWEELRGFVPDVDALNTDEGFLDWLDQPGPDGVARIVRLREDEERNDSFRAAQFFLDYKDSYRMKEKAAQTKVKDSVEGHIGPVGTKSSSDYKMEGSDQKGVIRQSEINKYKHDLSKGFYRNQQSKAEAMELRIINAMNENKIIFDVPVE